MAVRVTRLLAEVAGTFDSTVRVTRTMAEVLGTPAQPDVRLYRLSVMALVEFAAGTEVSASSGLSFSDSTAGSSLPRAAGPDTVSFSDTASEVVSLLPNESQGVSFSDTAVPQPNQNLTANNSLTFSQVIATSFTTPVVSETLTFSDTAASVGAIEISESHTVQFSDSVAALGPETVTQTVTFTDVAGGGKIIPGGIVRSAGPQTVQFTQTVQKVLCKAIATAHSGEDTVEFGHRAALPITLAIPDAFVLDHTATADYCWVVEHDLEFTHVLAFEADRALVVTQTLTFNHAVAYINKIDTCRYSPTVGTNTAADAPTPPPSTFGPIVKASQVTLFYPTVGPTLSVVIRAPEYGDRHRLQFDRINRETRGGTLEIFSDPDWPKLEIIEASFTGLKESEAQAVIDFFTQTLGLEVGFTDWHGRTWHGIVLSPDTEVIRARRDIVDLSFEFEGEVQ